MKIGDKKYNIQSSDCWLVFPGITLTVNIWTNTPNTYLITEPIFLKEPELLLETNFQATFTIEEVENIDSTLLENDKPLEIFNQNVIFDRNNLFSLDNVRIKGNTTDDKAVQVDTKTCFSGFEIWKMEDYESYRSQIENMLRTLSVDFTTTDEIENNLIRIKIKNRS